MMIIKFRFSYSSGKLAKTSKGLRGFGMKSNNDAKTKNM